MAMTINHASYHGWSGGAAHGGPSFKDPVNPLRHSDRAVWLAGQLEAPSWGVVQSYDGCGMSGGILNNIAVSPKDNTQGSFFRLLRRIIDSVPQATVQEMLDAFVHWSWTITEDGVLRDEHGRPVPGVTIRDVFTPPHGHVPKTGVEWEQAKKWLEIFFRLFSDPATYAAQSAYATAWLSAGAKTEELAVYRHYVDPHLDSWIGLRADQIEPHLEVAMCIYHAFSVNAPGEALMCLRHVPSALPVRDFAKKLVALLGTRKYGAWHDNPQNTGNRYDRTRLAVWRRGDLWDATVAHEVAPENLVGDPW